MFMITRKQSFNEDTFLLEFKLAAIAEKARPGQYVDIHVNPDGPVVTLPVAAADAGAGTFAVVEQGRDLPSERLMVLSENDQVFQIRGPLGSASRQDAEGKVVLVGEDLGVASLLWRAREFRNAGAYVIIILGFASRDRVFWQNEFAAVANELYVVTTDGSFGISGRVTSVLQGVCETHRDIERLVMIGTLKHMKRAARIASDNGIDARVSFDAVRFPAGSPGVFEPAEQQGFDFARAPEIDSDRVDFDKLIARERALEKRGQATADHEPEGAPPQAS